ncbi:hypothetical protein L6452_03322 [Arctium lappa]|uniref:Uncharacterized protein n=1 Tax=Arctium lappa TaxID=4217 RepID=A0ACB9FMF2_ARCLA|nr:hypothetical protein L6452_03322 [Arctium lappa]
MVQMDGRAVSRDAIRGRWRIRSCGLPFRQRDGRIGTRNALAWYLDVFFDDPGTDSDESLLNLGFHYESGKSSQIAKIPSQIDKITRLLDRQEISDVSVHQFGCLLERFCSQSYG